MKSLSLKLSIGLIMPLLFLLSFTANSQICSDLHFTYVTGESRCMATGSINVAITGGSGNYNVRVTGPVTTGFTSSTNITGLSAGSYTVTVRDITTGCVADQYNIVVPGSYSDPRFALVKTDVTCINGSDGTVLVTALQNGRSPFTYTLVAPSASHLGESNATGIFTGLTAGDYAVELQDSCGGRQTRLISVLNYNWWIDGVTVSRIGCDSARAIVNIRDSKGNVNSNASQFPGFQYGIARAAGDTVWSTDRDFIFRLNFHRQVAVVIKDACGSIQITNWVDPSAPSIAAHVMISDLTCSGYTATVTGQNNLTSAQYELYNSSHVLIATNASGIFANLAYGRYCVEVKDICYDTTITRCFEQYQAIPAVDASVSIWNKACANFTAAIYGTTNLINPVYRLYNSSNTLISTNNNGIFDLLPYGSYCIRITDGCYDTTIQRCFSETPPVPEIYGAIATSSSSCSTYTAAIQGTSNLTNPTYCLYNGSTLIGCNTTGRFDNLVYGINYYIQMTNDACYDTVITRYISSSRPIPTIAGIDFIDKACTTVTAQVRDIHNWTNPEFCIFDSNNVRLACNNTGVFPNLPYGRYCIETKNDAVCYDTVIRRCTGVSRPIPSMNNINISNRACSTFTARTSGNNLTDPTFILYNASGAAVDSNTTGIFNDIPYGNFCMGIRNTCYDTLIIKCSTEVAPKPEVGNVRITSKVCATFQAIVENPGNLSNATYRLYDVNGNLIATNTTGTNFRNVPYGAYTIRITTPCYDTTIVRSIDVSPDPIDMSITAQGSCTWGNTDLSIVFNTGTAAYTVQVLNPAGTQIASATTSTNTVTVSGLAQLSAGQQYTVIGIDRCNARDTVLITPSPSILNKACQVRSKCPTGVWANGASDIDIEVSSNRGVVTPQIIRKNGANSVINFTSNVGTNYKFIDLEPATYIIAYSTPGCLTTVYDTIAVAPYSFPSLHQSAAYQCDNNNFSVGAAVTGGIAPFTFEIIGSMPASPSIVTATQNNPIFNIANGAQYTLVRLRAVDLCGNATLNDVNILPLSNTTVRASSDCYYEHITMSVDTVSHASYTWYRKAANGDSTEIGTGPTYSIPYLQPSDTGTYINSVSVNGGCVNRLSYFSVTGACGSILPGQVKLSGKAEQKGIQLTWDVLQDGQVTEYVVERSNAPDQTYTAIGKLAARLGTGRNIYAFIDEDPAGGVNYYRLRMIAKNRTEKYTNTVGVRMSVISAVTLYPNPVNSLLNIRINGRQLESYKLTLMNVAGQVVHEQLVPNVQQALVPYTRQPHVNSGIYMLHITAIQSRETFVYKVVFK